LIEERKILERGEGLRRGEKGKIQLFGRGEKYERGEKEVR
jgi:hypothetical protein